MPSTIDRAAVEALLRRARREVDDGLLPSCQVALALHGELVAFEAFGAATTATRYAVFSATKPFVAAVVWQLLADGQLALQQPVADLLPSFAAHGKGAITVEQVLLHTAGFPTAPLGPTRWSTHEGRAEAFGRWRCTWAPGTAFEYHPSSAHWVLGELVWAVTGDDHVTAVDRRVRVPLGLPRRVLGVLPGDDDDIAPLTVVGDPPSAEELRAAYGVDELPATEVTHDALLALGRPEARAVGMPGGGGVMRAADLALFHQALLHNPHELWHPWVLRDATGHVVNRFPDPLTGVPANRTIGLVVAGDDGASHLRGMGRTVSWRAFGHNGAAGQVAWADPATGLSFAYCTNGLDANDLRSQRRTTALSSLAAVCAADPAH